MALRYLVPALAVAGRAAAGCSGSTTIQNSGDAMALSSCLTYSGDITVATGTTDDIALDGIRRIAGSLTVKNIPSMASLSGDSLQIIDDTFLLKDVTILSTLNFPGLSDVDTVDWTGLPNLQGLSFSSQLTQVTSLSIQNTQLNSLEGINLLEVDTLILANNLYLNTVSMQLGSVGTALSIEANGRNVHASFPELKWAYNMTFRNCSSIDIPKLASTNGSLGFYSNYFSSVVAPNLTTIGSGQHGGDLSFVSNMDLTNVSMPELKTVNGGLQLANNTELVTIDGFPRLVTVGGAIDFNGEFKTVSLPQLNDVKGAFNLQSTKDITKACTHFKPLSGQASVIKGPFTCKGETSNPRGTGTLKPGTNAGGGGASSSSGAAVPLHISGATGLMGVAAAIFGML